MADQSVKDIIKVLKSLKIKDDTIEELRKEELLEWVGFKNLDDDQIKSLKVTTGEHNRVKEAVSVLKKRAEDQQKVEVENISLHIYLKENCEEIGNEVGLTIFTPILTTIASNETYKLYKKTIGESGIQDKEKTIMVLGETGSGKSTLINGFSNYIYGTQCIDNFRVKLIHDEGNKDAYESQTKEITSYTMPEQKESKVPYTLHLIDTPGFNDTAGMSEDIYIVEQIRQFFNEKNNSANIDQIDAVGIVVSASQTRLTETQKYIYDAILKIFGKDIKENIVILITFCDASIPTVLKALKGFGSELEDPIYFKFNNSALFEDNKKKINQLYWEMGYGSFEEFFQALEQLEPKSLLLTKEVLEERQILQNLAKGLQMKIDHGTGKMAVLKHQIETLQNHSEEILANPGFNFEFPEQYDFLRKNPDKNFTSCSICNIPCHIHCDISMDSKIKECQNMGHGNVFERILYLMFGWKLCEPCCKMCGCVWNKHRSTRNLTEVKTRTIRYTINNLKEQYNVDTTSGSNTETLLSKVQKAISDTYDYVKDPVYTDIDRMRKAIDKLNKIALRKEIASTEKYIDFQIELLKTSQSAGWKKKLKVLQDWKKIAQATDNVKKTDYDPYCL